MTNPTVSVIITTYNRPKLLPRAIESVISQSFTDFECIIVDDCSSKKETKDIIESFDDERLSYIRHIKNRGLSAARNTGLELASGEYVAFLDDDDEWLPEKLEKQVELFEGLNEDFAMVYCWMYYINDSDGEVVREYCPEYRGYIFPDTLDAQPIGAGSTLLVRREIAAQLGGFDEDLSRGIDGDFIRRICKEYKLDYVSETLVRYHIEHGHERITQKDYQGIQNHIYGQKVKFDKFGEELKSHPARAANLYGDIAYHRGMLGQWKSSIKYYWLALKTAPTSSKPYMWIFYSVADFSSNKLTNVTKFGSDTYLSELSTAYQILRDNGLTHFINVVSFQCLPRGVFNMGSLIIKERAFPYPSGDNNYNVIKIQDLSVDRRMPAITTANYVPHGSYSHQNIIKAIYTYEDFISVENNDVVVEVGSYIGTWTKIAAETASKVIAIDPLAKVDNSLQYNVDEFENIEVISKAAWSETKDIDINISTRPNENSIFSPDSHDTGESIEVEGDTVPNIARKKGLNRIDYLKIEAEGAEPEILKGALNDGMEITKIAIDAGDERGEEDVSSEITSILERNGYDWKIKEKEIAWGENIIFARKSNK